MPHLKIRGIEKSLIVENGKVNGNVKVYYENGNPKA